MPQSHTERENILTGRIFKLMLKMSLPAILAMSINGINTFVDALFVGQYVGNNALAAVSLVFPLTMITSGLSALVGMGGASVLSIAIGNGDLDVQRKVLGTSTLLSLIVSVLLMVLGWVFAPELLALMGGKGEIQEIGVIYYRIMLIGAFFRIYAVAINMLIRAEGKVAEAMWYSIVATLLNIVLNILFIGYLGMGVEGAAWSTVVAMAVFRASNILYFSIAKKASFPSDFTTFSLERKLLRPIFSVGISAMLLQITFFVQQLVVFRSLAYYGGDWDITFMGACYRIVLLVILPGFGFAQAMQPIVGINFGAQQFDRVKKAFRVFFLSYLALLMAILLIVVLFPRITLGLMIPDTPFEDADIQNFLIAMVSMPFHPYFLLATTFFQGVGEGKSAAILLVFREIILFIPVVLLLPIWFGISGIYAAWLPVNLLAVLQCYVFIQRKFREWRVPISKG